MFYEFSAVNNVWMKEILCAVESSFEVDIFSFFKSPKSPIIKGDK